MASLDGLPPLPKSLSGLNLQDYQLMQQSSPRSQSLSSDSGQFMSARSSRSTPRDLTPSCSFTRSARVSPTVRKPPPPPPRHRVEPQRGRLFTLDSQLSSLRQEMFALRQMDLALLNQLWALNEAIQDWRRVIQDVSPPSPVSGDDSDEFYSPMANRGYSAFTPVRRSSAHSDTESDSSIEYGSV